MIDELLVAEGERVPVGTVLATVLPADANGARRPPEPAVASVAAPAPRADSRLDCHAQRRPQPVARAAPAAPPAGLAARTPRRRAAGRRSRHGRPAAARTGRSRRPTSRPSARPRRRPPPRRRRTDPDRAIPAHGPPSRRRADRQAAMREAIGALMARSKREIPHYYLRDRDRHEPRARVAARGEPQALGDRAAAAVGAAAERGRPGRRRDAGDERLLDRRRVPARPAASISASRSRCAAAA